MTHQDTTHATEAIERFISALNSRGDATTVAAAVSADARIERAGVGELAGTIVESIAGHENIGRWMALSPPLTRFSRQDAVTRDAEGAWQVRYAIAVADFRNTGRWRFTLDASGVIAALRHDPDPLPNVTVSEVRDPNETWRNYQRDIPVHHHQHGSDGHDGHDH